MSGRWRELLRALGIDRPGSEATLACPGAGCRPIGSETRDRETHDPKGGRRGHLVRVGTGPVRVLAGVRGCLSGRGRLQRFRQLRRLRWQLGQFRRLERLEHLDHQHERFEAVNSSRYERHRFRSMGTDVEVIGEGSIAAFRSVADAIEAVFHEHDHRFSRFRPDSELSWVNDRAGRWVTVSPGFAALVRVALRGARETDGLFDPTLLPAVIGAGYDRDFALLRPSDRAPARPAGPAGAWRHVRLEGRRLRLPPGTGLDFGGVAKGWAVDRAITATAGLSWAAVNAGGDLRVVGEVPDGELLVGVDDPRRSGHEVAQLLLTEGALATSSVTARTWGPAAHHLIDPRTWLPADTRVLQATVWAPTCAGAEIRSKFALLGGRGSLERMLAILVSNDGRLERSIAAREPLEVA